MKGSDSITNTTNLPIAFRTFFFFGFIIFFYPLSSLDQSNTPIQAPKKGTESPIYTSEWLLNAIILSNFLQREEPITMTGSLSSASFIQTPQSVARQYAPIQLPIQSPIKKKVETSIEQNVFIDLSWALRATSIQLLIIGLTMSCMKAEIQMPSSQP